LWDWRKLCLRDRREISSGTGDSFVSGSGDCSVSGTGDNYVSRKGVNVIFQGQDIAIFRDRR
jgi:hypothetical protein